MSAKSNRPSTRSSHAPRAPRNNRSSRQSGVSQSISYGYLPSTDEALRQWMNDFIIAIRDAGDTLGLDAQRVDSLAERIEAFDQALDITLSADTRTSVTVAAKRIAREQATEAVRAVGGLIRANPDVTDEQRIALGLSPRNRSKNSSSKVTEIATCPYLEIDGIENGGHVLRVSDSEAPGAYRLPNPRLHLLLFAAVSAQPVTDPSEARFVGVYTKMRIATSFPFDHEKRYVTYFARWGAVNNVVGPWSQPMVATLAFASPQVSKKKLKLAQAA